MLPILNSKGVHCSMRSVPKVSVVILTYNFAEYIEACVRSVINQSLKEIEIIIINDGSTDETADIIHTIRDERTTVVNKENGGVSSARNEGFNRAKGEYVFQLDGDDYIDANYLEQLYCAAKEKNADVLIATGYIEEYENTSVLKSIDATEIHGDLLKDMLLGNILGYSWLKLYKTTTFKENNIQYPLNVSYAEDLITDLYFLRHCKSSVIFNNTTYVHYRQREKSLSNYKNDKTLHDQETLMILVEKFLNDNTIMEKYEQEFAHFQLMQYCYAVINSRVFTAKHKEIYMKSKKKIESVVKSSDFIYETYKKLPLQTRIGFKAYKLNYHIGVFLKKMYLLISNIRKPRYILK